MAEDAKPVTQLPVKTTLASSDQVLCISNTANPAGGNATLISIKNLVGNSNFAPTQVADPANSGALTITQGALFFSNTFGYIAISNNVLRRFAISSF